MMPVIRPLPIQCAPPTEHQKERAAFAEMEARYRRRKRRGHRFWRRLAAGILSGFRSAATPER